MLPYVKSKTLAERAAWDFIAKEGGALELSVVNPVGVFGPVLGPDYSTSILLVQRLMDGAMPGCPAALFRRRRCARRRRFAHPRHDSSRRQGRTLPRRRRRFHVDARHRQGAEGRMGAAARRVPTRQLPNWLVRLASLRDPAVKQILPELGKRKNATNEKAKRLLGWAPRSNEEAIVATAESLVRLGLLKDSPKKAA